MGDQVRIDGSEVRALGRNLRAIDRSLGRDVNRTLRGAAEVVAVKARSNAGQYSPTIASSIRARAAGGQAIVEAGRNAMPIALLMEGGYKGHEEPREGDTWEHPVFGDESVKVSQPLHPYLAPAAREAQDAVVLKIEEGVSATLNKAFEGLKSA